MPSHSIRAASTAARAAPLVAEYKLREGAAIVAATDERWWTAGNLEEEASKGSCNVRATHRS